MQKITLTIGPDGSPQIETSGFVGKECMDKTREFELALGGKQGPRHLKPEAHVAAGIKAGGGTA